MRRTELTWIILQLNAEIDSGSTASIDEVEDQIEAGSLFTWLRDRYPGLDLSVVTAPGYGDADGILAGLQQLLGGYRGSERRKWGVENNGLCLLLAWTNELIQQHAYCD